MEAEPRREMISKVYGKKSGMLCGTHIRRSLPGGDYPIVLSTSPKRERDEDTCGCCHWRRERSSRYCPFSTFQSAHARRPTPARTCPMSLSMARPSLEKRQNGRCWCGHSALHSAPLEASHTRTELSHEPETMREAIIRESDGTDAVSVAIQHLQLSPLGSPHPHGLVP